jgi:hypothetical protein
VSITENYDKKYVIVRKIDGEEDYTLGVVNSKDTVRDIVDDYAKNRRFRIKGDMWVMDKRTEFIKIEDYTKEIL